MITKTEYRPHQKQIDRLAWDSVRTGKHLLVYGGKGTFKTCTLTISFWTILRHLSTCYKGLRYIVAAMTYSQLMEAFLEQWKEQVPKHEYEIKGDKEIKLTNSNTIVWLRHTGDVFEGKSSEKAARSRRGGNIAGYYFPQAESMSLTFFNEIASRVRGRPKPIEGFKSYPPYQLRWLDANPDNPMHWIKKLFLDPRGELYNDVYTQKVKTTEETSAYTQKQIDIFRKTWVEHDVARMLDAEWVGASGLIYPSFKPDKHIRKFEPKDSWTWYLAVDFGYNAPFCCLWVGLDSDGCTWVFDELYESRVTIDQLSKRVADRHKDFEIRAAIVDTEEPNAYFQLQRTMKAFDRPLRIMPGIKDVKHGIQLCTRKLAEIDDGVLSFHVHPRCENFIREITLYEWQPVREGEKPKEKPATNASDHAMDAWRYFEATVGNKRT